MLPARAPLPQLRPQVESSLDEGRTSGIPPIPALRPTEEPTLDEGRTSGAPPMPVGRPPDALRLDEGKTSGDPPIPQQAPSEPGAQAAAPTPIPSEPRPVVTADEMRECLAELGRLGVDFTAEEAVSDPAGCSIPNPVTLKDLGRGVKLAPAALLDCPMAVAVGRFMQDVVGPESKALLGSYVTSIAQASAYVCRPRHGGAKLSEHAYGNALDIGGFMLADGRRIDVKSDATESEAKFLDAVRKAACGPFRTVLGPGSDADHALHFHLDLQPRRNGSTFCQ